MPASSFNAAARASAAFICGELGSLVHSGWTVISVPLVNTPPKLDGSGPTRRTAPAGCRDGTGPFQSIINHLTRPNASATVLSKLSASRSPETTTASHSIPANGATLGAIDLGSKFRSALNFARANWASAERAFASAVSFRSWSPWSASSAICFAASSLACRVNWMTMYVETPTTTAAAAAVANDSAIMSSQAWRDNPSIRLTVLELVVFSVATISCLGLLVIMALSIKSLWRRFKCPPV